MFCVCLLLSAPSVVAQEAVAADDAAAAALADTVVLNHREIVRFRATLLGRSPAERAAHGMAALRAVLDAGGPGEVSVWLNASTARTRRRAADVPADDGGWMDGDAAGLRVDDTIVFYLLPDDLEKLSGTRLADAAEAVRSRLQVAVLEVKEMSDPQRIARGLAYAAGATLVASGMFILALTLRRRAMARLDRSLANRRPCTRSRHS